MAIEAAEFVGDGETLLGRRLGCTSFMVLLAAVKVVLHRLTDHDDVVVAVPAAGQPLVGGGGLCPGQRGAGAGGALGGGGERPGVGEQRRAGAGQRLRVAGRHDGAGAELLDRLPQGSHVGDDGRNLERVTTAPGFDGFPVFSPDGEWLVWASNRADLQSHETNLFIAEWVE